jgi:energy-coupling factor transporter ATP-binding protein EcfA2
MAWIPYGIAAAGAGIIGSLFGGGGGGTVTEIKYVPDPALTAAAAAAQRQLEEQAKQIEELQRKEGEMAAAAETARQHARQLEEQSRARAAQLQKEVEDVRAAAERTASDLTAARQEAEARAAAIERKAEEEAREARVAIDAATKAASDAASEAERLRAEQAAREAYQRELEAQEAARWAAEEEHLRSIGFNKGHYNFVVVGPSGAGKSTFINSLRGLYRDDPGAAKVGTGRQMTMESARYPMPGAEHIVLWDEPGGDTADFPADTYCGRRCLRHFDAVIALYNNRFSAVMSAIIPQAYKLGVPVIIVYTKVDLDVKNELGGRRIPLSAADVEAALRQRVRDNIAAELAEWSQRGDVTVPPSAIPVYFIDSVLMVQGESRFDEMALKRELVRCTVARLGGEMTAEELWARVTAAAEADAEAEPEADSSTMGSVEPVDSAA